MAIIFELQNLLPPFLLIVLTYVLLLFFTKTSKTPKCPKSKLKPNTLPKPYPIVGHLPAFAGLTDQEIIEWLSKVIACSPTGTVVINLPFGGQNVYTGNPANVEHIFKTQFPNYQKSGRCKTVFDDLFGDSLFTQDGDNWKFQRQVLAQEFTHKALHKYVEKVLHFEVSERLIPVLLDAAKNNKVIDLQDILQRFAFDNVCNVIFGCDPGYLSLPLPEAKFTEAFDECITICHARFHSIFPIVWKICRFLNIGSEKRLRDLVKMAREFTSSMIESVKNKRSNQEDHGKESNLLVKLLECDQFDDKLVVDLVLSTILAGRDTSSSALTWFFWLLHKNKHVELEVLQDVKKYNEKIEQGNSNLNPNSNSKISSSVPIALEALKGMTYTHAALSECMRLYPPVPVDLKEAAKDDVLPDGTKVKKGAIVGYFAQAMGWSEKLWGSNWAEFLPERWLREENDSTTGVKKRSFVPKDAYTYPVFLAGPRTCLGKEMAYFQMKGVVAAILSRFKVIPAVPDGFEPVYVIETVATMHGGFPVRIEERVKGE